MRTAGSIGRRRRSGRRLERNSQQEQHSSSSNSSSSSRAARMIQSRSTAWRQSRKTANRKEGLYKEGRCNSTRWRRAEKVLIVVSLRHSFVCSTLVPCASRSLDPRIAQLSLCYTTLQVQSKGWRTEEIICSTGFKGCGRPHTHTTQGQPAAALLLDRYTAATGLARFNTRSSIEDGSAADPKCPVASTSIRQPT